MKKIFKFLLLLLFSFITIISILNIEVSLTVNNTFFSDKYFNKVFDSNITSDKIEEITYNFINNMEEYFLNENKDSRELEKTIDSYKKVLNDNIDINWLKEEIPFIIKDSFKYLSGNKKDMPVINIKPIKDTILNVIADQVILNAGNISKDLNNFIKLFKSVSGELLKDGKANSDAVNLLVKSDIGKNLKIDKETAERIIEKIATINEDNSNEIIKFVVKEMISSKVNINEMNDELDLNLLFKNFYENNNPIEATRNIVVNIKTSYILTSFIILISLILLITFISYNIKNILKWCGTSFIIAGLISITSYQLYKKIFEILIINALDKIKDTNLLLVKNIISDYINGIIRYFFIQSIIIIVLGTILIVVSIIIKNKTTDKRNLLLRFIIIFTLIIVSILSIINFIRNIKIEIKEYNEIIESVPKEININHALDETLNTTLFEDTKKE